jgi:ketosteroid isomerase-like protein
MMRWIAAGAVCMAIRVPQEMARAKAAEDRPKTASCSAPQYSQFNFWAGDWDVFDAGNPTTAVARAHVDLILDGCVLREDYQGADGHKGQSFTIYDATKQIWRQTWVTNCGEHLVIEGKYENEEMVLIGEDRTKGALVRGKWKPENGDVRETAFTSEDSGKTWRPWFDLIFRPHKAGQTDDERVVADLDTRYQAAVKVNDAATMALILSDGFVLVTGSGKSYSKAELLAEARSGRVHYEHQEDTEQSVRIWGDTAVITAKLWEKGTDNGKPFDYTVWFSDTYVRTAAGWRYVFGQSSLPLPKAS